MKYKFTILLTLLVFVAVSCQKGGEPVPYGNLSSSDMDNASQRFGDDGDGRGDGPVLENGGDDGTGDGGSTVIGGDDNEDDDDGDNGLGGGSNGGASGDVHGDGTGTGSGSGTGSPNGNGG